MKGKLIWVLLGVSLAANVFFAAGALYAFYGKDRHGWRAKVSVEDVAEKLALSPAQSAALEALREDARNRLRPSREDRENRRAAFLAELAKPDFDRVALEALMAERRTGFQARFLDRAEALHGYLSTLTPEQRAEFLELAKQRGFLRGLFGRPRSSRAR